jgi:hypothetical protein
MGHILLSKDILRVAINDMTDQEINEASITNALRYREGAILEHGRPSLKTYLELIKAFAKANKFEMEISKNPDTDSQVLIISFKMGLNLRGSKQIPIGYYLKNLQISKGWKLLITPSISTTKQRGKKLLRE